MKLLTFSLVGPLCSFGENSRWDHRDSAEMPTKSAVIGLLGCCFGWKRDDGRLRELNQKIHMAVRCERRGRLMTDYQTVQGANGILLNAEHKRRPSDTIITPRQYLQDAAFQVFLFGEEEALMACEQAMSRPKWMAYLGRRSCPPTRPMLGQIIEMPSVEEALRHWMDPRMKISRENLLKCEIEQEDGETKAGERLLVRRDTAIRADQNVYEERKVRAFMVKAGELACT